MPSTTAPPVPRPLPAPRAPRRPDPVLLALWAVFLIGFLLVSAAIWFLISGTSG